MGFNPTRLPHSEISGSKVVCTSPKLIAAYHVFHRLLAPRHPLYALNNLISHSLEMNRLKLEVFSLKSEVLTLAGPGFFLLTSASRFNRKKI